MSQSLTIWYITDNKPGHLNQLKGLAQQLNHRSNQAGFQLNEHWITYNSPKLNWRSLFGKKPDIASANAPSMVIGAGHKTHLKLLAVGLKFNAYTAVLMRPSLPLNLFDAAIIPEHDRPPRRRNILETRGVLNTVQPKERKESSQKSQNGLMLVGGESKHYLWNSEQIINQINEILNQEPSIQWTLSNSRRTPAEFLGQLNTIKPKNLRIVDCEQTDANWLPHQIDNASKVWVSPDSVSMVYEAITSGSPTGLFTLPIQKINRINSGIQQLVQEKMVTEFAQWESHKELTEPAQSLWESDRAAKWLLEQFQQNQSQ